jgi:trafficking protein particle complex subunit 2
MSIVFMVVGRNEPLYEAEFGVKSTTSSKQQAPLPQSNSGERESSHLSQFIIHSSLDLVERKQWYASYPYLRVVDKFNEQLVSSYITAAGVRLMLLHDGRGEDGIGTFFKEVHELYVKVRRALYPSSVVHA